MINPAMIIVIAIMALVLWFCLSSVFADLGKALIKFLDNFKKE